MNNENKHIETEELIGKYLAGEAGAGEVAWLERGVKESPENEKTFADYKRLWIMPGVHSKMPETDLTAEWKALQAKLLLGESFAPPGSDKGEVRILKPFLRYAAILIILAAITGALFYFISKPGMKVLMASDAILIQPLPDGSEVTLNLGSKLIYPVRFSGSNRTLTLEGDAFFKVQPDQSKPFVVKAGAADVTVLGTSFYVNAKPDKPDVEVIVSTGKVSLKSGREEVILMIGEKGTFDKITGTVQKEMNEDENYISWKTRKLIFRDERLRLVFGKIEETFGVRIRALNPEILDCRLTATFDNQQAATVMEIIGATFGFDITVQDEAITVSGSNCTK
ncbi:MAG: DUF4974 domain-containing protein [Bacteroidetes bacterium]|nr:DUF4974 domain-containing protein [Bacteroidota bacterium]